MECMADKCSIVLEPEPSVSVFVGSLSHGAHWGHYCSPKCALSEIGEALIDMINESNKPKEEEATTEPNIDAIKQIQLLYSFCSGVVKEVLVKLGSDLSVAVATGPQSKETEPETGAIYPKDSWYVGNTIPGLGCVVTHNLDLVTFEFDNDVFNFNISPANFNIGEDYEGVKNLMTNILDAVKSNAFDL